MKSERKGKVPVAPEMPVPRIDVTAPDSGSLQNSLGIAKSHSAFVADLQSHSLETKDRKIENKTVILEDKHRGLQIR